MPVTFCRLSHLIITTTLWGWHYFLPFLLRSWDPETTPEDHKVKVGTHTARFRRSSLPCCLSVTDTKLAHNNSFISLFFHFLIALSFLKWPLLATESCLSFFKCDTKTYIFFRFDFMCLGAILRNTWCNLVHELEIAFQKHRSLSVSPI